MQDARQAKLLEIRHSFSHVMAEAVLQMFPGAKLAIGPAIDDGFYYDFDLPRTVSTEDLAEIEKRMRGIVVGDHAFTRAVLSREAARRMFKDQPYKLELIEELPEGEEISTYTQDTFTDLCRGPHVAHTRELAADAFKLTSIAGAYWRGDEKNKMLQRIYGTAWDIPRRARGPSEKAGGDREARPPQAGQGARPLLDPRGGGRRAHLLAPQGRPRASCHRGLLAQRAPEERLRASVHPAHRQGVAVGDAPGTSGFTSRTCTHPSASTRWITT